MSCTAWRPPLCPLAARLAAGQLTTTPLSSVTITLVSATFPVFFTSYVQVTGDPGVM